MGRNSRLQSCKRFWSSRSAKGSSKEEESGKGKGNFQSSSLSFFLQKQNLIFLWCGSCYAPCFFPKTILFSQHFAWSVLSLVVFKTSSICKCQAGERCRCVVWRLISPHTKDWCFMFVLAILSSCLYSQPCHESSCRQTAAQFNVETAAVARPLELLNAMLDSVAIATSAASFLTLNTCK